MPSQGAKELGPHPGGIWPHCMNAPLPGPRQLQPPCSVFYLQAAVGSKALGRVPGQRAVSPADLKLPPSDCRYTNPGGCSLPPSSWVYFKNTLISADCALIMENASLSPLPRLCGEYMLPHPPPTPPPVSGAASLGWGPHSASTAHRTWCRSLSLSLASIYSTAKFACA